MLLLKILFIAYMNFKFVLLFPKSGNPARTCLQILSLQGSVLAGKEVLGAALARSVGPVVGPVVGFPCRRSLGAVYSVRLRGDSNLPLTALAERPSCSQASQSRHGRLQLHRLTSGKLLIS